MKQRPRGSALNGRLPTGLLLDLMETDKLFHRVRKGADGKPLSFITAPLSSILLDRTSSNAVFIKGSTYNTNNFKMLFYHEVSVAATNQTISPSLCFLSENNEENHSRALL